MLHALIKEFAQEENARNYQQHQHCAAGHHELQLRKVKLLGRTRALHQAHATSIFTGLQQVQLRNQILQVIAFQFLLNKLLLQRIQRTDLRGEFLEALLPRGQVERLLLYE